MPHEDTASCLILNHAHVAEDSLHLPSNSMEIIAAPQNGILFRCFRRGVVRFFPFPESVKIDERRRDMTTIWNTGHYVIRQKMVCIHPERVTSLAKHSIYPEIISPIGVISFVSGILQAWLPD